MNNVFDNAINDLLKKYILQEDPTTDRDAAELVKRAESVTRSRNLRNGQPQKPLTPEEERKKKVDAANILLGRSQPTSPNSSSTQTTQA